jgi:hypothetical protein
MTYRRCTWTAQTRGRAVLSTWIGYSHSRGGRYLVIKTAKQSLADRKACRTEHCAKRYRRIDFRHIELKGLSDRDLH